MKAYFHSSLSDETLRAIGYAVSCDYKALLSARNMSWRCHAGMFRTDREHEEHFLAEVRACQEAIEWNKPLDFEI